MQKILLLIGKALIVCGALFPFPLWYVLEPLVRGWHYKVIDDYYYDFDNDWLSGWFWSIPHEPDKYWIPMFVVMGLGLLLCLLSRYRTKDADQYSAIPFRRSTPIILFYLIGLGLILVGAFMLLTVLVIAFWYLFLTERGLITIPICFGIFLIWLGYMNYHENHKNDR